MFDFERRNVIFKCVDFKFRLCNHLVESVEYFWDKIWDFQKTRNRFRKRFQFDPCARKNHSDPWFRFKVCFFRKYELQDQISEYLLGTDSFQPIIYFKKYCCQIFLRVFSFNLIKESTVSLNVTGICTDVSKKPNHQTKLDYELFKDNMFITKTIIKAPQS
jgi:hypothetical protein